MEFQDKDHIDEYTRSIINTLKAGIDALTPWSNPSPRSISGFSQECKDICREVQQLRRRWQRTRLKDNYETYREARNRKDQYIHKTLRSTHRYRVEEASASESGLWKLVKWAKNRHTLAPACTPDLRKPDGELAHQAGEKAEALRQSFFPPPLRADQTDINGYKYLNRLNARRSRLQRSRKQCVKRPRTRPQAPTTSRTASSIRR